MARLRSTYLGLPPKTVRFGFWLAVFLVWLDLHPTAAFGQTLTRQPYLQMNTPTSMTLVWRTSTATTSRVRYGVSPQALGMSVTEQTPKTQHEIKITGLAPDTRYFYEVGTATQALAGGDPSYTFRTSPAFGVEKKMRLWIVGDSGTGGSAQKAVRDSMLSYVGKHLPDLFLHMGDIAYDTGTEAEFQSNFFAIYETILRQTVCWPTLGNHEGVSSDSATQTGPYYAAYVLPKAGEAGGLPSGTEAYYSFDYGHVHFIVLDSQDSSRSTTGPMLTWLKSDLAATKQPWIIAYWHHPPYSKGSHDSDTESQLIQMRQNALPILEAGGVDLILAGHSHIYERSYLLHGAYETPSTAAGKILDRGDGKLRGDGAYKKLTLPAAPGTVYVVAGHGGAGISRKGTHPLMYFTEGIHGSCLLDIEKNTLTLSNLRRDGVVSDTFTLAKGDALIVTSPNGGERLAPGQKTTILWKTIGSRTHVRLSFSSDAGRSWTPITGSIPNAGTYDWTTPLVSTEDALIKVEDATDPKVSDESNATFAISPSLRVIRFGDRWRYHALGQDLGTAWVAPNYNDTSWLEGAGQLGYGDGDEATVIPSTEPRFPSVYFRKEFQLPFAATEASFRVLHDDGVIVWINGQEVFSKYAAGGSAYRTWASQGSSDNEQSTFTLQGAAALPLVPGKNVIAVMVKQSSSTSSDLSFDLSLDVTLALPPSPEPPPERSPEPATEPRLENPREAAPPQEGPADLRDEPSKPDGSEASASEPWPDPVSAEEPHSFESSSEAAKEAGVGNEVLLLELPPGEISHCFGCSASSASSFVGAGSFLGLLFFLFLTSRRSRQKARRR